MAKLVRVAAILVLAHVIWAKPASAFELISAKEGKMEKVPFEVNRHAVGRGPSIRIYGPKKSEPSAVPFDLQIRFEAYGGATIDEDSLRVIYFSWPRTDLTSRLRPKLLGGALHLQDVSAPPGEHQLQITVRDSRGYEREVLYEFRIE